MALGLYKHSSDSDPSAELILSQSGVSSCSLRSTEERTTTGKFARSQHISVILTSSCVSCLRIDSSKDILGATLIPGPDFKHLVETLKGRGGFLIEGATLYFLCDRAMSGPLDETFRPARTPSMYEDFECS